MRLRYLVFAVIYAHMPIQIEESHSPAVRLEAQPDQFPPERHSAVERGKDGKLAAQRFNLRRTVETEQVAEFSRSVFLKHLRMFYAQKRHKEHGQNGSAQAVKGRADITVNSLGAIKDACFKQGWYRQQHTSVLDSGVAAEHWRGVMQEPYPGQEPVDDAVIRILVA
jgi:hypothetical protein